MDGIVYFGSNSLNLDPWVDRLNISRAIDALKAIVSEINASKFARVRVPSDWSEFRQDGVNFWEKIDAIIQGQNDLLGYIATSIFDAAFNQCVDEEVSVAQAENTILINNPDVTNMRYFSALKVDNAWPGIPDELQVGSKNELWEFGLKFLSEEPHDEKSYADRCHSIFPNLFFHPDFSSTLTGHGKVSRLSKYSKAPIIGIRGFSNSVTRTLAAMNSIKLDGKVTKDVLSEIQAKCNFECSPEGSRNSHLVFDFMVEGLRRPINVNCEFHVKISENNRKDSTFYQDRLYFGFITVDGVKRIAVAHSGVHLNP